MIYWQDSSDNTGSQKNKFSGDKITLQSDVDVAVLRNLEPNKPYILWVTAKLKTSKGLDSERASFKWHQPVANQCTDRRGMRHNVGDRWESVEDSGLKLTCECIMDDQKIYTRCDSSGWCHHGNKNYKTGENWKARMPQTQTDSSGIEYIEEIDQICTASMIK